MAGVKMSALELASSVGRSDMLEIVQAGVSKRSSVGRVRCMDINEQTGTAYALVLDDAGKVVEMNNAAANTLTILANATVAFEVGESVLVRQMGVGQTTIVAASGVTIRNPHGTLKLSKQYAAVSLHKRGTDEWCVEGNLAES